MAHQDLFSLYINSMTWNHTFIILDNFIYPKKRSRIYAEAVKKGQNGPNSVTGPSISVFEKEYLDSPWTSDANILITDVQWDHLFTCVPQEMWNGSYVSCFIITQNSPWKIQWKDFYSLLIVLFKNWEKTINSKCYYPQWKIII